MQTIEPMLQQFFYLDCLDEYVCADLVFAVAELSLFVTLGWRAMHS